MRLLCYQRLAQDRRGTATVEFALVTASMIAMTPLVWDVAQVVSSYLSLSGSMRAGVQYALSHPNDSSGIASVIQNATGFTGAVTVTTAETCECSGASATCGTTCSGGGSPAAYDTITASYNVPTLLPYAGYPTNYYAINRTETIRVQ